MHLALARKYRPRSFGELIGQEHVGRGLRGAVEQNRVAHGYLLCGPRGVGKTTAARILAMALNCETLRAGGRTPAPGEPCGRCASCERIWSGSASLDVVEIDAASNRGVDDARDLRERAMYAASREGGHKVYIVDEAHMLTREAWNTLLKVLEEPPPGVVFVFATTEPHKITNTAEPVMSRLQRFDFRRVGPQAIAKRLEEVGELEKLEVERDAVELIARVANGGLRDALSVLDQVVAFGEGAVSAARVREVLGLVDDESYAELFRLVVERDAAAVFPFVARIAEAGVDLVSFAQGAGDLWRAVLAMRLGVKPEGISTALAAALEPRVADLSPGDALRILRALEESEEAIARGSSPRLALETLLARWALMDRTVEIEELLRQGPGIGNPENREAADDRVHGTPMNPPAPTPNPQSPIPSPPSLDSVRAAWPAILDALRADRRMLAAEALATAAVAAVDGSTVVIEADRDHPAGDIVVRYRAPLQEAMSRVLGSPIRVAAAGEDPLPAPPAPPKVQRVSVQGARAERTRSLRGKDPALDGAMDALDLELLD